MVDFDQEEFARKHSFESVLIVRGGNGENWKMKIVPSGSTGSRNLIVFAFASPWLRYNVPSSESKCPPIMRLPAFFGK
jgi:hypothetical protein